MGPAASGGLHNEPNVVPMIDILLVLLIAAILWALPAYEVRVQMPVPAEPPPPGTPVKPADIVLSIAPGPTYSVNSQPIARGALITELAKIYDGRPTKVIFIDADRTVPYQDVFWVYGAVRSAGITVTAIVPKSVRRPSVKPDAPLLTRPAAAP